MEIQVERWWSTERSQFPGVVTRRNQFEARVSWRGSWVTINLYRSHHEARRATQLARKLKSEGRFSICESPVDVRAMVLKSMGQ